MSRSRTLTLAVGLWALATGCTAGPTEAPGVGGPEIGVPAPVEPDSQRATPRAQSAEEPPGAMPPDLERATLGLSALAWPTENLLTNGGLESTEGWETVGDASLFAEETATPAEGARAVSITSPRRLGASAALRSAPVAFGDARRLLFSGQFRAEGGLLSAAEEGNRAGVMAQWLTETGQVLREDYALILEGAFAHWRRLVRPLTPPPGAAQVRLLIGAQCASAAAPPVRITVDDLALMPPAASAGPTIPMAGPDATLRGDRVTVTAHAQLLSNAARVALTVAPAGPESGAAEVTVAVPLGAGEWTWHPDLIRAQPLRVGDRHSWTLSADRTGTLPMSLFPVGAVSSATETIGVVVPPTQCAVAEIRAARDSAADARLEVIWRVGFAQGRAESLELWLHRGSGAWGARGVYARHLALHPEHFLARGPGRRAIHMGTAHPPEPLENPRDFGARFFQTEGLERPERLREVAAMAQTRGIVLAQYLLPFADEPTVAEPGAPLPSLEEILAVQARGAGEQGALRALRLAGAESLLRDTNGDPLVAEVLRPPWRRGAWVVRLPMDLAPDLSGGRGPATLDLVRQVTANADALGVPRPAVQLDNFMMDSDFVLVDAPHVEACRGPLTFSPNTLQPAAPLGENHARWLAALSDAVGTEALISGNVLRAGVPQFGVPFLDAFSFECRAAPEPGRGENWAPEELALRRALGVRRPIAALVRALPPRGRSWNQETFTAFAEQVWHRCLVFAITPTMVDAWERPDAMEALRPLYRRFIPIVERLEAAGWQPLTHAVVEPAGVIAERYGREGEVLLALHSPRAGAVDARVRIDWDALGLTPRAEVQELVRGRTLPVEEGQTTVPLPPGSTAVLVLAAGPSDG